MTDHKFATADIISLFAGLFDYHVCVILVMNNDKTADSVVSRK